VSIRHEAARKAKQREGERADEKGQGIDNEDPTGSKDRHENARQRAGPTTDVALRDNPIRALACWRPDAGTVSGTNPVVAG